MKRYFDLSLMLFTLSMMRLFFSVVLRSTRIHRVVPTKELRFKLRGDWQSERKGATDGHTQQKRYPSNNETYMLSIDDILLEVKLMK